MPREGRVPHGRSMHTVPDPPRPDGRRTGAAWVAATGAFLLVAAAATFVAVRWDLIPDVVKLAVVAAVTGGALFAGRSLRDVLPATSGVLFHLGAFLLPVDVAAVAVHVGVDWRGMVLAQGLVGTGAFAALAVVQRSATLAWATTGAAVVLAAGVAGPTGVPTAVVVAVMALAVHLLSGRLRGDDPVTMHVPVAAIALASLAGTVPLLRLVESALVPGRSVLVELGLTGSAAGLAAVVSSGLAAVVLGAQAARRDDADIAVLALLSATVGLTATWLEASPGFDATVVALAAGFLAVEVAAAGAARDPFWARPSALVAQIVECLGGLVSTAVLLGLAAMPLTGWLVGSTDPAVAAAAALSTLAWLTADLRRRRPGVDVVAALAGGGGWTPAAGLVAVSATAAAAAATGSPVVAGVVLLGVAAVAVAGRRPLAADIAAVTAVAAPVLAGGIPAASIALGVAGALLVGVAVERLRISPEASPGARQWAWAATAAVVAVGTPLAHGGVTHLGALVGAAVAGWLVAVVLDRCSRGLGHVARVAVLSLASLLPGLDDTGMALGAAALAALAIVEAARLDRPRYALAASALAPVVLASSATAAGLTGPAAGLALCVAATAWLGLAALADAEGSGARPWALPLAAAASASAGVGLVLAATDAVTFGNGLLVVGATALAAGVVRRRPLIAHAGIAAATIGVWSHLAVAGVELSEAYLLPVGLHLLGAGVRARRADRVSTWTAYGPAVVLLGGTGLVERFAGGGGGHALWAGAVATAAVAAGGRWRLAGPLLTGTGLLVALTVVESLAWSVDVPTWAWLAAGGAFLLVTGIAMDRMATGPVETGRRMVDVVRERFE
jgi:hypothetical protein